MTLVAPRTKVEAPPPFVRNNINSLDFVYLWGLAGYVPNHACDKTSQHSASGGVEPDSI